MRNKLNLIEAFLMTIGISGAPLYAQPNIAEDLAKITSLEASGADKGAALTRIDAYLASFVAFKKPEASDHQLFIDIHSAVLAANGAVSSRGFSTKLENTEATAMSVIRSHLLKPERVQGEVRENDMLWAYYWRHWLVNDGGDLFDFEAYEAAEGAEIWRLDWDVPSLLRLAQEASPRAPALPFLALKIYLLKGEKVLGKLTNAEEEAFRQAIDLSRIQRVRAIELDLLAKIILLLDIKGFLPDRLWLDVVKRIDFEIKALENTRFFHLNSLLYKAFRFYILMDDYRRPKVTSHLHSRFSGMLVQVHTMFHITETTDADSAFDLEELENISLSLSILQSLYEGHPFQERYVYNEMLKSYLLSVEQHNDLIAYYIGRLERDERSVSNAITYLIYNILTPRIDRRTNRFTIRPGYMALLQRAIRDSKPEVQRQAQLTSTCQMVYGTNGL